MARLLLLASFVQYHAYDRPSTVGASCLICSGLQSGFPSKIRVLSSSQANEQVQLVPA